jgi:hypothetical protein
MISLAKALLLCGLYITSNAQFGSSLQSSGQSAQYVPTSTSFNQVIPGANSMSQSNPSGSATTGTTQSGYHLPETISKPISNPLPPVQPEQHCVPNNNFHKIDCSTKGQSICARSYYGPTSPYTTCGVSHLGVKYDFHDE